MTANKAYAQFLGVNTLVNTFGFLHKVFHH